MARRTILASREVLGSSSGELVPEGDYDAVISNCTETSVKSGENKGEPMYKVECKILDEAQKNRRATKWVCLFPGKEGKALISFYQLMKAIGDPIELDEGTEEQEIEIPEPRELIGQEVRIRIKHEPYQGSDDDEERMTYKLDRFLEPRKSSVGGASAPKSGKAAMSKAGGRGKTRVKL